MTLPDPLTYGAGCSVATFVRRRALLLEEK